MISHGDFAVFLLRPISLIFLLATLIFLLIPLLRALFKPSRKRAVSEA